MLQIVFDDEQATNLTKYVDDVWEFTRGLGCVEVVQRFSYLRDVATLIAIPGDEFESFYSTMIGRVSDDKIYRIIRCRKDRDVVQKKIFGANDIIGV